MALADTYNATRELQMSLDWASLVEGDEDGVLMFATRWGPFQLGENTQQGDPLWLIWLHAKTLALVRDFVQAHRYGDESLAGQVAMENGWTPDPDGTPLSVHVAFGNERESLEVRGRSALQVGEAFIQIVINRNIKAVYPELAWVRPALPTRSKERKTGHDKGRQLARVYRYRSLAEAAYWNFADHIENARPLVRCQLPECGRLFVQNDKRQRFCPPQQYGARESLCGLRYRTRNYRAREKGEINGDA
jgi:hypothetical protein